MEPRFSICVPIRNGAKYLPHTLRLCAEQQFFDDYEIVISDNQSSEDIKSIVDSFNCDKMHYFRTPEYIGMGTNFDFALDNAKGEYKLIIGSDDGISRNRN
jgi:glycosyltransferase involved in cell wall biosynthesis